MTIIKLSLLFVTFISSNIAVNEPLTIGGPEDYKYLEQRLDNAKAFTIEVMQAMPADQYSYKPTDDVRTFAAQAFHIAYTLEWYLPRMDGKPIAWEPGDENRMTKEELVAYTSKQFDEVKMFIMKAHGTNELTDEIMGLLDHNSHHRGQMVTYLRLNNITPPQYR